MSTEYGSGGDLSVTMDGPFAGSGASAGGGSKIAAINAPVANWKGGESPFSMSVGVDGVSISSKVDVQIWPDQLALIGDQIITFMAANNGGIVTLYAFGDKPRTDLVLQAAVTETTAEGVVLGNMVATNTPRADYSQTDETKADFIRNKPDVAIQKAQSTADGAKKTAEDALPKSGGAMTGNIAMGGNMVSGLKEPSDSADAANKGFVETYVDSKRKEFTVNLSPDGWTGTGPYVQTVAVDGILSTDRPHVGLVPNDNTDIALTQEESWGYVSRGVSGDGSITFTCYEDKPEISLSLHIEVNR